jgi:hypothetical protein
MPPNVALFCKPVEHSHYSLMIYAEGSYSDFIDDGVHYAFRHNLVIGILPDLTELGLYELAKLMHNARQ